MRGSQNNRADVNRRAGEHELVRVVRMQQPLTHRDGTRFRPTEIGSVGQMARRNRLFPAASIKDGGLFTALCSLDF